MADKGQSVLLLAGRLRDWPDAWRVAPLASRLRGLGFKIEIVCAGLGGGLEPGAEVTLCPGLAARWLRAWTLRQLVRRSKPKPDLLHVLDCSMSGVGRRLAERWKLPYVLTIDEFLPPGGRLRVSRQFCRILVTPTTDLATDLIGNAGVPPTMVEVVLPGLSLPDRDGTSGRTEARVPVVGAAGRLVAKAGLVHFLEAARETIDAGLDVEFIIAGRGRAEAELRYRATALSLADRVTFTDDASPAATFWPVLDVYCQPALGATVGGSLATAIGFGVPSLVSDVPGLRSWIPDGSSGLRIPPGDSGALARKLIDLLTNPERARALGARARDRVAAQHRLDAEVETLAAIYRRVLSEAPTSPPAAPQSSLVPVHT